jgi:hypothetical protein
VLIYGMMGGGRIFFEVEGGGGKLGKGDEI